MSIVSDFVYEALARPEDNVLAPVNTVQLGQFHDDDYWYLLQSIGWRPNADTPTQYPAVTVPKGFVTDLTSTPRVFWQVIPRTGVYLHAAIVHDYLYWIQGTSRQVADKIFDLAMADLKVNRATRQVIFQSVDKLGGGAWKENGQLKAAGERRVLKTFPTDPMTRWADWKQLDVFQGDD